MVTEDETVPDSTAVTGGELPHQDAPAAEETENRPVSRLVFPVAGYGLLPEQHSSMEFFESGMPYHIPNSHPLFRGLINRRGSLVPVFEIRTLLDEQYAIDKRSESRVLVLGSGDDAVGIVLDSTPYRIPVSEDRKTTPPVALVQAFGGSLGACYEHEGECVAEVALEDFLYALVKKPA